MADEHRGTDRVHQGEASLGEAQSDNPPDDPDMIEPDAAALDSDVEFHGDGGEDRPERGNEDPAPNAP